MSEESRTKRLGEVMGHLIIVAAGAVVVALMVWLLVFLVTDMTRMLTGGL